MASCGLETFPLGSWFKSLIPAERIEGNEVKSSARNFRGYCLPAAGGQ